MTTVKCEKCWQFRYRWPGRHPFPKALVQKCGWKILEKKVNKGMEAPKEGEEREDELAGVSVRGLLDSNQLVDRPP